MLLPFAFRGIAASFAVASTVTLTLGELPPDRLKSASGLFSVMRNLGGAIGIATCATIVNDRTNLHFLRIAEHLNFANAELAGWLGRMTSRYIQASGDVTLGQAAALRKLWEAAYREAQVQASFAGQIIVAVRPRPQSGSRITRPTRSYSIRLRKPWSEKMAIRSAYCFMATPRVLAKLPRRGIPMILHEVARKGRERQAKVDKALLGIWDGQAGAPVAQAGEAPGNFHLDACRHGGMTELEEAELTDGQGRALSAHKSRAYEGYAKRTMERALAATRKRHAHRLANTEGTNVQNDQQNSVQNDIGAQRHGAK